MPLFFESNKIFPVPGPMCSRGFSDPPGYPHQQEWEKVVVMYHFVFRKIPLAQAHPGKPATGPCNCSRVY